jgi:predicted metal-dependent peptidase
MKPQTSAERKLMHARVQLLISQPFFGSLCLRLKLVPGSNPTMATDGRHIFYNPTFVDALEPSEVEGVLAHEVMHCALGHQCRRGDRDPKTWNEAADYAINPIILQNGFALPKGVLVNSDYQNLCAEEIYARLMRMPQPSPMQQPPQQGAGSGGGNGGQQQPNPNAAPGNSSQGTPGPQPTGSNPPNGATPDETGTEGDQAGDSNEELGGGGFGEVLDAVDDQGQSASDAEKKRQQQEWSIASEQAIRTAKACGHAPADVERPLTESRQSRQDWRSILRAFIAATTPADYRWTPPNRRYVAAGIYLPSVERQGVGRIVIGVDTSGSIGQRELEQFAAEITAIADEAKPEAIYVVYCDAAVQSVQEFGPSEPIELEPKGGGGTEFCPVFAWVEENCIDPVCLIYLTDLCCYSFPEAADYPVLWVTDSRKEAPLGDTIHISLD